MMSVSEAAIILGALKAFPAGATPQEIARTLARNPNSVGARLGKLAMYGVIDRERIAPPPGFGRIAYRYMTKRKAAHV